MTFAHLAISLVIILATAKVLGELSERLGQPAVLGELIGGVLIGPNVLGWVGDSEVIRLLAEIGAVLLLFEVGLESDLEEFLRVGVAALSVALVGIALPMTLGYGLAMVLGLDGRGPIVPLFMGATLAATSVGITARVLADIGHLQSKEAKVILGAAVLDDVLGLIVLATIAGIAATGSLALGSALTTGLLAVVFLVGAILIGIPLAPYALRAVGRMRTRGKLISWALVFCLFLAWSAERLHLAAIIGAFAAGLVLAKTDDQAHIKERVRPLADIFVPIFFVWLGFSVRPQLFNPAAPGGWHTILVAGVLVIAAVIGKVAAGYCARVPGLNRLAVGVGMVPRGEVGLIFASLGLSQGIIDVGLYAVTVAVVLLTTVITPPMLKWALAPRKEEIR
ncbi:MAG: cation:proton antiporter [Armatimonadota bacterium]